MSRKSSVWRRLHVSWAVLALLTVAASGQIPGTSQTSSRKPAVGIISLPELRAAADVLTAVLSSDSTLSLVERNEIDGVLNEQRLTAGGLASQNYGHLGRLLGADGLLFLDTARVNDKPVLAVRIVASGPGVIVGARYAPYWYDEPAQVLKAYDAVLTPHFNNYPYAISWVRHHLTQYRDKPNLFGTQDLDLRTPWLIDWKGTGKQNLEDLWRRFVQGRIESPVLNDRLDGWLLALCSTDSHEAQTGITGRAMADVWTNRETVVSDQVTFAIATQLMSKRNPRSLGELCHYSETERDWRLVDTEVAYHFDPYRAAPFNGGNVIQPIGCDLERAFILYQDGTLEFLFPDPYHLRKPFPTRWPHQLPIWEHTPWNPVVATSDGNDLWVLGPRLTTESAPLNLYLYTRGASEPKATPLYFPSANTENYPTMDSGPVQLLGTPEGLIIAGTMDSAFWFLPKQELQAFFAPSAQPGRAGNASNPEASATGRSHVTGSVSSQP